MLLDTENKLIIINNDNEYIKISDDIIYYNKKNKNGKYHKYILSNTDTFKNYSLSITVPHVIEYKTTIDVIDVITDPISYNFIDLFNKDMICIRCSCIPPRYEVVNLLKKLKLTDMNIAEIGIRYSSTSKQIVKDLENNIKKYDLYELEKRFGNYATWYFKDNNKINVYIGEAQESLKNIDSSLIYDFVFFDASHKYEIDKQILNELVNHLNNKSILLFDDYDIPDMNRLIDEFIKENICTVYIFDNNENICDLKLLSQYVE